MNTQNSTIQKSNNGYWMLFGIFALLMAPIVIDHVMNPAAAQTTRASTN